MSARLPRLLARLAAAVPSPVKYRLRALRPAYTTVLRWGGRAVLVQTAVGPLHWQLDGLTSQTYLLATYEPYMQQAFRAWVRPGMTVYDIGAHAGFHTLFCGLLVGPGGRVVAFEPNPASCASLARQARANPALPITVLPYALSDCAGSLWLEQTAAGSSESRVAVTGTLQVEARTLDELVAAGAIPPPALIKIDVEGHEKPALRGALATLGQYHPIILCDYNDATTLPMLTALLTPLGYGVQPGPPITARRSTDY